MRARMVTVVVLAVLAGCSEGSGVLSKSAWPSEVEIGHDTDIGTTVGFGGPMMLINDSSHDATIVRVELEDVDDGLELAGWVVRDVLGRTATGVQEPFPPSDARDGSERTITPSTTRNADGELLGDAELVIGMKLTSPGVHSASGVRVVYEDDDGTHTVLFQLTTVLCERTDASADGCSSARST